MSVLPSLTTVSVVATNAFFVPYKYPLVFLKISLGVSDSFGNWLIVLYEMIPVLDSLHPVNSGISA